MLGRLKRRQTLASFDYQWGRLCQGDAMLSDPWFLDNVDRILWRELLGVDRGWFAEREVLDAGCGGGRWSLGFLRLGSRVTAVDASERALDATCRDLARLAPPASTGRLTTARVDLLDVAPPLSEQRFDLVFSFGVLHHTGDTRRALANLAALVQPDGLLFVYLYGAASLGPARRALLGLARSALAPLPFGAKRAVLARLLPGRSTHQAFDLLSPLVNERHRHETVEIWLRELGFGDVARTLDSGEIFLRAARDGCSARPFLPPPPRPYWFERYRRS
jgi:SAM-dependent methyltransferase